MKFFLCILATLIALQGSGQDIFLETFSDEADCANSGFDETEDHSWSSTCNESTQCDANTAFCGVDAGFQNFEFKNLNGDGQSSDTAYWMTSNILIDPDDEYDVNIELDVDFFGNFNPDDCFRVTYSTDGGVSYTQLGTDRCDGNDTPVTGIVGVPGGEELVLRVRCIHDDDGETAASMVLDNVRIFDALLSSDRILLKLKELSDATELCWNTIPSSILSYHLEQSTDGRAFQTIATKEVTDTAHQFCLKADPSFSGKYYRIVGLKDNQELEYSNTVFVPSRNQEKTRLLHRRDGLDIYTGNPSTFLLILYNLSGREVWRKEMYVTGSASINYPPIPDGLYFTVLTDGKSESRVSKVFIEK